MFWEDCRWILELWAGKAAVLSELHGLFCGRLENKNVEKAQTKETWLMPVQRQI